MPNTTYNLLDDDGLLYAVQYIFTKLKTSPLNVDTTYDISLDTTNQWIVLTGNDGSTDHVSYADFGDQNIIEVVKVNGTALVPDANKAVNIPAAGATDKGVISNADVNALIQAALNNRDAIKFIKVANFAALPADYDSTATYALGDLCKYNNVVYQCTTAISTAEAWNPDHWEAIISIFGAIFLVPNSGATPNIYDEYVWMPVDYSTTPITYGYEKIGTTAVDLSGYVQYTDISLITNTEIVDIVDDAYDAVFNPTTP